MAKLPAPIITAEPLAGGVAVRINSGLHYRDANLIRFEYNESPQFGGSGPDSRPTVVRASLYAPTYWLDGSSWLSARTVYVRAVAEPLPGSGDQESDPSNVFEVDVAGGDSRPPLPVAPNFRGEGCRNGICVTFGGVELAFLDVQYTTLRWRRVPTTRVQRLWQPNQQAGAPRIWQRTWTEAGGWGAWAGAAPPYPESAARRSFYNRFWLDSAAAALPGFINSPNSRETRRPSGAFIGIPALVAGVTRPDGTRVLVGLQDDARPNVDLAWYWATTGVTGLNASPWRRVTGSNPLPEGTLINPSEMDGFQPRGSGASSGLIVVGQEWTDTDAPTGYQTHDYGVLYHDDVTHWPALGQRVLGSEYFIDNLVDGADYEIAASSFSYAEGPVGRIVVEAGGEETAPVIHDIPPAIGSRELVYPTRVESDLPLQEIQLQYRQSPMVGDMAEDWRTLRASWLGDSVRKDGFTNGGFYDFRLVASSNPTTTMTRTGVLVGFTPQGVEIPDGWFTSDPGGEGLLWRTISIRQSDGEWVSDEPVVVQNTVQDGVLASGRRTLRGPWGAGKNYGVGDQVSFVTAISVEGTTLRGAAGYLCALAHRASHANRPHGHGTQHWVLVSLPSDIGADAPREPPKGQSANQPPQYAVRMPYSRVISELDPNDDLQPRLPGALKFGSGGEGAYVPSNRKWVDILVSTVLSMAGVDARNGPRFVMLEKLAYAAAQHSSVAGGVEEHLAVVWSRDRWIDYRVVRGRRSANLERMTFQILENAYNESGGSGDLGGDEPVEIRIQSDDIGLPEDNAVTDLALPGPTRNTAAERGTDPNSIRGTWLLPNTGGGALTAIRAYVRPVEGFQLGELKLLAPDATEVLFDDLASGDYYIYVIPQNDAGLRHPAERAGPVTIA